MPMSQAELLALLVEEITHGFESSPCLPFGDVSTVTNRETCRLAITALPNIRTPVARGIWLGKTASINAPFHAPLSCRRTPPNTTKSDTKYDMKSYRSRAPKQGRCRKYKKKRELRRFVTPPNHTESGGHEIRTRNPLRGTTFPGRETAADAYPTPARYLFSRQFARVADTQTAEKFNFFPNGAPNRFDSTRGVLQHSQQERRMNTIG